jgi:hypothetical protein
MAASVDQPLMLLQPHPGLMSGDDPACATRLDVTEKPDPLRFTEGMGGVDLFATTKLTCKRMLRHYHRSLTEHAADWYVVRFPARLASYWDRVDGMGNMRRDGHLTG